MVGGFKKSTSLKLLFDQEKINASSSCSSPTMASSSSSSSSSPSPSSINEEILSVITNCKFLFIPTNPSDSPSQQELKRVNLTRLLSMLKSSKKPLPHRILSPLISIVSENLFRPLPPPSSSSDTAEDDDPAAASVSPIWPHLQIIYEILLRLVSNTDPETLKLHIDRSFLLKLVSLFNSEDPRERESLKNVYHKIYTRFTTERWFMRKSMNDVLLNYAFETTSTNQRNSNSGMGIAEMLEIWGTIINGFTVPLKEEHKLFLMRVLIPLHKTKGVSVYYKQLGYCVVQFVQKEPMLGGVVVRGMLKYWPVRNCQKEMMMIGEMEDLVENLDPDHYRKLALPLCTQLTKCVNSWNSQVAERALYVWNNEQFVKMVSTAMVEVFPVIAEGMEKNLRWHWNESVRRLTEIVKVMVQEMDPVLYSKALQDLKAKESASEQEALKRKQRWELIELAATQNQFRLTLSRPICVSN